MYNIDRTWKQNILDVMGDMKWKSHRQIFTMLGLSFKTDAYKVKNIYPYIAKLIRSGHIEKAHAPQVLKDADFINKVKYVYRRTGKPFVPKFVEAPTVGNNYPKETSRSNKRYDAYKAYVAKRRLLE